MSVRATINRIATALARAEGWRLTARLPARHDFTKATDPRSVRWRELAEAAYEAMYGDRPDYAADDEELSPAQPLCTCGHPIADHWMPLDAPTGRCMNYSCLCLAPKPTRVA